MSGTSIIAQIFVPLIYVFAISILAIENSVFASLSGDCRLSVVLSVCQLQFITMNYSYQFTLVW